MEKSSSASEVNEQSKKLLNRSRRKLLLLGLLLTLILIGVVGAAVYVSMPIESHVGATTKFVCL